MINEILSGISNALENEFGENYEIYNDEMPQDFLEPCFFIACIGPSEQQIFNSRYKRIQKFDIQYFPKAGKKEIYGVIERLNNCLEYIKNEEDILRGTQRNSEIVDGVLHYFVNYDFFVKKLGTEDEYMRDIKTKMEIK